MRSRASELDNVQGGIGNELEWAELEMEFMQCNIFCTHEAIVVAQAVLQAEELKFDEIVKYREALVHQQVQMQQEVAIQSTALEDVRTEASQHLTVGEYELHHQAHCRC